MLLGFGGFFLSKQQPFVNHLVVAEAVAGVQNSYIQYDKINVPQPANVSTMMSTASNGDGSRKKNIVVAVLVSLSAILLFGFAGFFIWNKLFRNKGEPKPPVFRNKGEIDDSFAANKSMC